MTQLFVRNFFQYLFFFFCFFVLWHAKILDTITPFAVGICLALIWCKQKPIFLLPLFLISAFLHDFSIEQIIGSIFFVLTIMFVCKAHTHIKKTITFPLFVFYGILAQVGFIFSNIYFQGDIIFALLETGFSVLFLCGCKDIFSALFTPDSTFKFGPTENMGILILICTLSIGFSQIYIFGSQILFLFAPGIILLSSTVKNTANTALVSSVIGLGACFATGGGSLLAPLVVWALTLGIISGAPPLAKGGILLLTDAILGFGLGLHENYSTAQLLLTTIGTLPFCFIPTNALQKLKDLFCISDDFAMRNIINRNREILCKRLWGLSDVFAEMDYVFRSMLKGGLSKAESKHFIVHEAKDKVCANCPERNICHRKHLEQTSSVLDGLVETALQRGKATLLDTPTYLTSRCGKVPLLVSTINQLCTQYRQYASAMNNIDASRILIADELKGLSKILKKLANEVNHNITLDNAQENKIIAELALNNIFCQDAVIYEENAQNVSVTLIIRKADSTHNKIPEIVSKICKRKMSVATIETSKRAGWNIITLVPAPKFSVTFGTASQTKDNSPVSGDAYSIIKLTHDKFLLALCDGMGSGQKAEKTSSLAISLVENFYKAGFDNDIILSSVNKLLSINNDDVFSALDICVLDTFNGTADFVKMGAPESLIKHQNTTSTINAPALPLGIVQDAEPAIIKEIISNKDFVFMFTDGISDSFESQEKLEDFINNLTAINPQILAETLLKKATELSNGARDDMTVIVAKIFTLK